MTADDWAELQPWADRQLVADDGTVVYCLGLAATLYFRRGFCAEKRQAMLACFNEYLRLCESSLKWWVVENQTFKRVAKLKSRDMSPYLLAPSWDEPAAESSSWALLWHGGEQQDDASPFAIEAFGASLADSQREDALSYVRVSFPLRWFAKQEEFVALIQGWCERLQPEHGYGGVTIIPSANGGVVQMHESELAALAIRHPGIEIDDPLGHALGTLRGIKGGNWLTVLSTAFVDALGGQAALAQQLAPEFGLRAYPGGVLLLGEGAPEIGDRNRGEDTPKLRKLARVLRPIRVREHAPIHTEGPFSEEERFTAWLARFDPDEEA